MLKCPRRHDMARFGSAGDWTKPLLLGLGLASPWLCLADGYRNPPAGVEALATSGMDTAGAEGATAITRNPANLGDAREAAAGLVFARQGADFTGPDGRKGSLKDTVHLLPHLYFAAPVAPGWSAGLALHAPYGQSVEWEDPNPFRYVAPDFAELRVTALSPALAWRPTETVAIGVTLDVLAGDLKIRQAFPWSQVLGGPAPDGQVRIDADGEAVGGSAGLTWTPAPGHRLSAVWRKGVDLGLDGSVLATRPVPLPLPPAVGARSDFATRFHFPDQVSGGWRIPLAANLGLELGVEWLGWSSNDRLPLDGGANQALFPSPALENDWKDTVNPGASLEWRCAEHWHLLAGYAFHHTPVPDANFSPTLTDSDRHLLSAGAVWSAGAHRLSVGLSVSRPDDATITSNSNPAFLGRYELESTLWGISYSRTFP